MSVATVTNRVTSEATVGPNNYTVVRGDNLTRIAHRHGLSLRALIAANPQLDDPDLILPGESILLPGHARAGTDVGIASAASQPVSGPHANVVAVAEQYLGRNASDLRADRSDNLPMQASVSTHFCCANFVSAVLVEAGQLRPSEQTASVETLKETLQRDGWTQVSPAQARPGDVVISQGRWPSGRHASHVVMMSGPGQTIGSNNRNADGSQRVTHGTLRSALSASNPTIWRAPAGLRGSSIAVTSATATVPVRSAGAGALAIRQAEAIRYFEAQGWTHAQATGIVANLTKESDLSPIAVGDRGQAYGLAQWHPDRQAAFARFTGHDIRVSTFGEQLAFVAHELRTTERGAGARLARATDAADAGAIISRSYERPADAAGEARARAQLATQLATR